MDLRVADVTFGAEVDAALDDSDVDTLADVGQVTADSLELARGHFDSAAGDDLAKLVYKKELPVFLVRDSKLLNVEIHKLHLVFRSLFSVL